MTHGHKCRVTGGFEPFDVMVIECSCGGGMLLPFAVIPLPIDLWPIGRHGDCEIPEDLVQQIDVWIQAKSRGDW